MAKHEFGIIPKVSKKCYDTYEPNKYDCISIHDDLIEPLCLQLSTIDMFAHSTEEPYKGLAYCGITLIPPTSLREVKMVIENNLNEENKELEILIQLIDKAILEEKYIIHYGI